MSCNCGCDDDKTPATGWRRFVPLILGPVVVGALIAGAALKNESPAKMVTKSPTEWPTVATTP